MVKKKRRFKRGHAASYMHQQKSDLLFAAVLSFTIAAVILSVIFI